MLDLLISNHVGIPYGWEIVAAFWKHTHRGMGFEADTKHFIMRDATPNAWRYVAEHLASNQHTYNFVEI